MNALTGIGQAISRYGLALTLAWIGFGTYIKMESRVLIEHSPFGALSFLLPRPAFVSRFAGPIPVLSALPGQFLLKDVVLLGVAVWPLGEAVQAHRASSAFDADREQVGDGSRP
jgi:uncharacterized membrane protein YkgB